MRTTWGPQRLAVVDVAPGRPFPVWRIVRSETQDDPVLLNSLRSNYELGGEPRKVELSSTVIHMGISAYLDERPAIETARRWSKLGDYVARIELAAGQGFNFAHTGQPFHLTIWADPIKLLAAIVDIQPVG